MIHIIYKFILDIFMMVNTNIILRKLKETLTQAINRIRNVSVYFANKIN